MTDATTAEPTPTRLRRWHLLMLAALGVLSNPGQEAEALLNLSVASLAIRHWWMKTYFPRVRDFVLRQLRCKDCPNKPE